MVLVLKWPFFKIFLFCLLWYSRTNKNNTILGYKKKKIKKAKNWHFSKGVNPWFSSKNGHFSNFFFLGNIGYENVFYDILEQKNTFLGYQNKTIKKSKNWHFSKGFSPWFCSKNGHFSNLGNIGQENVFHDILKRKNAFLGYKNKKYKQSKIDIFPKGVTHGFGSIIAIFQTCFFLSI